MLRRLRLASDKVESEAFRVLYTQVATEDSILTNQIKLLEYLARQFDGDHYSGKLYKAIGIKDSNIEKLLRDETFQMKDYVAKDVVESWGVDKALVREDISTEKGDFNVFAILEFKASSLYPILYYGGEVREKIIEVDDSKYKLGLSNIEDKEEVLVEAQGKKKYSLSKGIYSIFFRSSFFTDSQNVPSVAIIKEQLEEKERTAVEYDVNKEGDSILEFSCDGVGNLSYKGVVE